MQKWLNQLRCRFSDRLVWAQPPKELIGGRGHVGLTMAYRIEKEGPPKVFGMGRAHQELNPATTFQKPTTALLREREGE